MDGNDNVIEKDFASAFDHERRGGFWGISPGKIGSFCGGKGPNHPKEKTQRTWLSNEMSGTQTMPTVIGISIFFCFFWSFSLFLNGYEADSQLINLRHLAARGR